ncbi:MAG: hypothetical protein JXA25_12470 [Anaerolineales bacterium]|nr:hypothetical protein [Anaerolineales bacterium]
MCESPEITENCPEDCTVTVDSEQNTGDELSQSSGSEGRLLFHQVENAVTSFSTGQDNCYSFNMTRFLDGGYSTLDGSESAVLELQDFSMSEVTAKAFDRYFFLHQYTCGSGVFLLEVNTLEGIGDCEGYISEAVWDRASETLAVAIMEGSGCYPDYMDARIDLLNREGTVVQTLVRIPIIKSRIFSGSRKMTE